MSHTAFLLGRALALVVLFGKTLGAIGPKGDLTIANKVIAPDGVVRDTVLAGGTFPGPLIKANKGDRFQINVVDKLTNQTMLTPTSVHWHGLHQHTTNWADGPAFVTQCPITTGNSFLYDFSAPDQAGTFWYHSHINTQYCDGLRGPLVIYDPHDPYAHLYDVDNENTIITLSDWYHLAAVNVPIPAMSDSTLINGKGRYFQNPTAELAVINVQHGKRYRFRLVSLSCDPNYNFTIDGHQMMIIEADGEATQPVTVDEIQIFAAQRYSFVLDANQTVGNYWIHANPNNVVAQGFANGINSAILRYQGAPIAEPTTNTTINRPLNETDLHPLNNPAAPGLPHPGGVDVALDLNLSFNNATTQFAINGVPYVTPSIPVLLQILSGNQSAQSLLPQGSVYDLPLGATVEVSIPAGNVVGGPHPFHLHGHSFYVVRSAGSSVYNYANPVRRDTVSIGQAGDNVTIRFVTDNSGPWFLHCHIDFHLLEGLAIVFAEGAQRTADANPVPAAWKNLCPTYQASLQG